MINMPDYKAPIRDIEFVFNEVLDMQTHFQSLPNTDDLSSDMIGAIWTEAAKFCEQVLAPLNRTGDEHGCKWSEDGVETPPGFKEAYKQFVEGGWPSMTGEPEFGGQGVPDSVGMVISEMVGSSNWAWGMYPGLSEGAMFTISSHGTEQQKQTYLPKLVSGEWTGTMCLTESHCGSDLGILRSKAEPQDDGSYDISGTKIFISSGEHDMSENIVHVVLARLPGAPEGTKGISLFLVPKYLTDAQGNIGERNTLSCGSIEHKMGIHGNSTCVMNFDKAKGYLIGEPNRGLNCMFTFMNFARIGTAIQGSSAAEASYQGALSYAKERLAMRSLKGAASPDKPADPIIVHPDVRRMLLTMRTFSEGGRALIYYMGQLVDTVKHSSDQDAKKEADELLVFVTPIAKAFLTETGIESTNLGVQVFGGHGYIAEWGMEQLVRDCRISTIYEGTTGIQSLDLLGRKVLMTQGEALKRFTKIIHKFCQSHSDNSELKAFIEPLAKINKEWGDITLQVGMKAMKDQDEVGAASFDYLMYSGYVTLAFMWAKMAVAASNALANQPSDAEFYKAKLFSATFYFQRILPRTSSHKESLLSGAQNLMDLDVDSFSF